MRTSDRVPLPPRPPHLPPRAASLPVPRRPPSRSPPAPGHQPGVQLPPHPPISPPHRQVVSGHSTPSNSPLYLSGIRFPVISCPFSSHPVSIPKPVQGAVSQSPTPEWDDYSEELQFDYQHPVGDQLLPEAVGGGGHDLVLAGVRKIPIVSTDCSDLESLGDYFSANVSLSTGGQQQESLCPVSEETNVSEESETFSENIMAQQIATSLSQLRSEILDDIDDLPASSIEQGMEAQAVIDRDRVWEKKNLFRSQVRNFLSQYGDSVPNLKDQWEPSLSDLVSRVTIYRKEVTIKVEQLRPSVRMTEFEKKSLELQEKVLLEKKEKRVEKERMEKEEGLAKAKEKLMAFKDDYDNLLAEISADTTPYTDRDDVAITTAMQDLKEWKKTFSRICSNHREYERLASVHGEQDLLCDVNGQQGERDTAYDMYERVRLKFDGEKKMLEKMDASRGLFSNHKSIGEKLDYPKFSGASSEDFTKFYDKMVKALRHNKVPKADQVERLRKNLTGFALGLVPESTENIEKAFTTLKAAFGDPKKVLEDRMRKLKQCGDLPGDKLSNNKNGFRKQEEWYLNMEGILYDIIELGKRDEDLAYEAFSESTFNFVLSLFPINLVEKLEEVQGNRKQKLEAVLTKFSSFREKARRFGKVYGDKVPPGGGSVGSVIKQPEKHSDKHSAQPGTFFRAAQDYPECRICKQLESDGTSEKLYEKHLSTYPTGCPRFISMKMVKRKDMAIKAKLCLWCLDPDVEYDTNHRDSCRVQSGKIKRFTCEVGNCKNHMWLCSFHKVKNNGQLKKHQEDLKQKGLDMVLTSWCVRADRPVLLLGDSDATEAVTKAVRKDAKDNTIQVNPVPEGRAMFLFFHSKGKKNGVNCFFDNGCTEAVFKEGIPGGELIGEKTTKGPFTIGGVGGLECKANDEWMVSFERTDGHRQLVRGLTLDKVTDNFPHIRLGDAAAELKAASSSDWVKNCQTPKQAGGSTDVLIGIQYNLIHPEPVHTLESGLCIFRSKLAPHKTGCLAMIGGPHSSFDILAGLTGGTARMVAQFVSGLDRYRSGDWSAPKVADNPMTEKEIMFARAMNACEGERMKPKVALKIY